MAGEAAGGALVGAPMLAPPPEVVGDDIGELRVKTIQHLQHCLWKEDCVCAAIEHPLVASAIQRLGHTDGLSELCTPCTKDLPKNQSDKALSPHPQVI